MSKKKQRIPTGIKITLLLLVPLLISAASIYYFASEIHEADQIYPQIRVAGFFVSGMTRDEATDLFKQLDYNDNIANASVSFTFPDESVLTIEATDVNMQHNANEMIFLAYTIGRGRDLIHDFVAYLQRQDAEVIDYDVTFWLDKDELIKLVGEFVSNYNEQLYASKPIIHEDRIEYTVGAGDVFADVDEIIELAYYGLFESFENGNPIDFIYELPDARRYGPELIGIRNSIFVQTLSSSFDPEANRATESAIGVDFDTVEAAWLIKGSESGKTVTIPLIFTHPEISQEYLAGKLYRDLLGERTTFVHGNDNRVNNVRLSAAAIHRLILLPGEEFSYNEVVGRRTSDRGYRVAPAISGGVFVSSVGGGVCQTSSTLFAAIKPTELLILEQRGHSRSVQYLPRGWDAAVSWDVLDFKFANNTDYPIRIEARLIDRDLTIKIWGTIVDEFPIAADWADYAEWLQTEET